MGRQHNTTRSTSRAYAFGCETWYVLVDASPILARAKLSALRSRGKCVAGYSPPHTP